MSVKGVKVTKDNLQQVLINVRRMGTKQVLIGIPQAETARDDGPETNAQIGYIQEFGSPARHIPARPFLVPGVSGASDKMTNALKGYAAKGLKQPSAIDQGLEAAGLVGQAAVRNYIRAGKGFAPLSERTLAERRSSGAAGTKPLIRTGQLLASINYVVRKI